MQTCNLLLWKATILFGLGFWPGCGWLAAEEVASGANAATSATLEFNPTVTPTIKWLSEIRPIPNAAAETGSPMQAYTETI